jgi:hypothetical protein
MKLRAHAHRTLKRTRIDATGGRAWPRGEKDAVHTDYALRVLIQVATADGKLITINDIAQSFDISTQHLMRS